MSVGSPYSAAIHVLVCASVSPRPLGPAAVRTIPSTAKNTIATGIDAINAQLIYHRFDSDRLSQHYGNEWDALVAAKKGRWTATAKLASYDAHTFATDSRKLWLQLEWAY